ncbi:hypothetical protein MLC44_06310 [Sulfurimonas sp. NW9]
MDKEVGYININGIMDAQKGSSVSKDTEHYHTKIDKALERWMNEGEENIKNFIDEHWNVIEKLASLLLEKEIIYEDELDTIIGLSLKK